MIRNNIREMKKKRAFIAFLMIFIMMASLVPQSIFAVENDKIRTKQELAQQSEEFDQQKAQQEKSEAEEDASKESASAKSGNEPEGELRSPDVEDQQ